MKIIQNNDKWSSLPGGFVDQQVHQIIKGGRLGNIEHTRQIHLKVWNEFLKRGDEILKKANGVVIAFVQRKPG